MSGFEPGSSGIGGDRSANCATTTALCKEVESKSNKQEVSCTVILPLKLLFSGSHKAPDFCQEFWRATYGRCLGIFMVYYLPWLNDKILT